MMTISVESGTMVVKEGEGTPPLLAGRGRSSSASKLNEGAAATNLCEGVRACAEGGLARRSKGSY